MDIRLKRSEKAAEIRRLHRAPEPESRAEQ
jgi:hypothetical protein